MYMYISHAVIGLCKSHCPRLNYGWITINSYKLVNTVVRMLYPQLRVYG